jgi:hypothetical protein
LCWDSGIIIDLNPSPSLLTPDPSPQSGEGSRAKVIVDYDIIDSGVRREKGNGAMFKSVSPLHKMERG